MHSDLKSELETSGAISMILLEVSKQLRDKVKRKFERMGMKINFLEKFEMKHQKPDLVVFQAQVRSVRKEIKTSGVVVYNAPSESSTAQDTVVQSVDLTDFEIIQHIDNVAVSIDYTNIPIPVNHYFYSILFDNQRAVSMPSIAICGKPRQINALKYRLVIAYRN